MKRHVPKDILECDSPMLKTPPVDLLKQAQNQTAKRSAWMLCTVIPRINAALEMYKQRFCSEGYNRDKTVRLHPSEQCTDRRRTMGHKADGSCWSFAHEELPTINIPEWFADESRVVTVECNSTKGVFEIDVHPEWAPLGAARFIDLVEKDFWTDMPLWRKNQYIVQFGEDQKSRQGRFSRIRDDQFVDDPHLEYNNGLLWDGAVSYAGGGPNTRTSGIFIVHNRDSQPLGREAWEVPFGNVTKGMDVVRSWYSYGEPLGLVSAGHANAVDVQKIYSEGNAYLHKHFPRMDYLLRCGVKGDYRLNFTIQLDSNTTDWFVLLVHRRWQPNAARRLMDLVEDGFFSASGGARFFRVLKNYIAQFGIAGDPAVARKWRGKAFQDDVPVRGLSNRRGTLSFATGGPNTRSPLSLPSPPPCLPPSSDRVLRVHPVVRGYCTL